MLLHDTQVLDPRGITPDWLDYVESWLLMTVLDALHLGEECVLRRSLPYADRGTLS